jgi:hypothetical protein
MALIEYSLLTIGLVPIPLSTDLTATVSNGLISRKMFSYSENVIPATKDSKIIYEFGETLVKGKAEKKDISIKGEDNITLTLTQSNDSRANKLFTLINSVLAVATGINSFVDVYSDDKSLKSTFKKANDLILKQLTICSYWDFSGDGSFFNYRLIDASFDKSLDEGTTTISMTFSNYYNQTLTNDEVDKINNTNKL